MGAIFRGRKCYTGKVKDRSQYSTDEQFTGKYWIDGKPLYRKVIECTSPSTKNQNTTIYDQLNNTIVLRHFEGIMYYGNDSIYSINSYIDTDNYIACWRRDATQIGMKVSRDVFTNCSVVIIIEYTKTTD